MRCLSRPRLLTLGLTLTAVATACGNSGSGGSQVASLGTAADGSSSGTATTVPVDTEEAYLAFAACLREQGLDVQDPTFDVDGNLEGGIFGPDSGIDMRSDEARAAMDACQDLIAGLGPGGGRGGPGFDATALQDAFDAFTECLRDEGLEVDDIDMSVGPGGGPQGAGGTGGAAQPPTSGDVAGGGGFQGGPPPDGPGDGGPDGAGFDPTARLIEQLGLDADDPAVTAALDTCQPLLTAAFDPNGGGTATTGADTGS